MRRILPIALLALAAVPATSIAQGLDPGRRIVIGVVEEGVSPGDDIVARVETELARLTRRHELVFKRDPAFNAGWQADRMVSAVQAAMDDPEVEFVLVVGALASQAAGQVNRSKPVVTTFIQRPDLFDIHEATDDRAVDSNLVIVSNPLRADGELRQLLGLLQADTVALAVEAAYVIGLTTLAAEVAVLEGALGITVLLWPVDPATQPDSAPPGVKAVALGPTPRLAPVQRQARIELLATFGLASYSLEGLPDVEAGVLMTRTPDQRTQQARRVALNLSELIRGTGVAQLPVFLSVDPALYLNGTTAARIGYSPRLSTLIQATILNESDLRLSETPLDLPGVQIEHLALLTEAVTNTPEPLRRHTTHFWAQRALEGIRVELENLVADFGVEPFTVELDQFDRSRQEAVRRIATCDEQQNGVIAERLAPGFQLGERVIVAERVTVYVLSKRTRTCSPSKKGT